MPRIGENSILQHLIASNGIKKIRGSQRGKVRKMKSPIDVLDLQLPILRGFGCLSAAMRF